MICIPRFYDKLVSHVGQKGEAWDSERTFLIEDRLKDLLWCDQKVRHFPNGHLKVHLWELEKPESDLDVKSN